MAFSKLSASISAAFLFSIILWYLNSQYETIPAPPGDTVPHHDEPCALDIWVITALELKEPVRYARLDITVSRSDDITIPHSENLSTTAVDVPLPAFHKVVGSGGQAIGPPEAAGQCVASIKLRTSNPPKNPPDASHMIFGVTTTLERLERSLDAFAHWASYTNVPIYALVKPALPEEILSVKEKAEKLHFKLHIAESDAELHDRYFSLVALLYSKRDVNKTQWIAIIEDETFFLSMTALVERLARYDTSKPQYIGGITEDSHQEHVSGHMGYGGAGIFLSVPLVAELIPHLDSCNTEKVLTGDSRIAACIQNYTATNFTSESDLHPVDLNGDASGFYESGRRPAPLSVNHWRSWHRADVIGLAAVEMICGYECMLQRFRFSNGWWLTNGYSLVKYSEERPLDDAVMESTWAPATKDSQYSSLAPLRRRDYKKISYRLTGVIRDVDMFRQFYVRRLPEGDQVFEVVWHGE